MWRLLEAAAKSASANASEYVSSVSEKAQSLVASVQDEAATLLHALGSARTGPVDEILYEEIEDYKAFTDGFEVDERTDEIAQVLRSQEDIRDLHEQLVPEHLSYAEFWSRFFFRVHQEEQSKRLEEERREQERLERELRAAEQEDVDVDPDFDSHGDSIDDDGDVDGGRNETAETSESASESDVLVQRARDADKRAALAWKKKAAELQKKLGAMAAQLEEAKRSITEEKDIEYQNLCDSYEAKMTEVTMQIDDARAVGYDAGIQESEAIIATMRQAADEEIERLSKQLALRQQGEGVGGVSLDWRADANESVLQLKETLSLKTQTLASVSAEKVAVETLLVAKDEEIAALSAQVESANKLLARSARHESGSDQSVVACTTAEALALENSELKRQLAEARVQAQALEAKSTAPLQAPTAGEVSDETKREIDLWRMRALKMKKLKETAEAELQEFKATQQHPPQSGDSDANLRSRIAELETQCKVLGDAAAESEAKHRAEVDSLHVQVTEATTALATEKVEAFQRGVAAGKSELEAQILALQDKVEQSYESGFEAATWATQKEIDLLRTEIALLRAGSPELADSEAEPDVIWSVPVPVLGDEFSDTDAMSHSIDNLSAVFGGDASASEGEGGSETWDASASVSDVASDAARDDWGEW